MRKSAPYLDGSAVGGISAMRMDYLGGFHYQGTALKFFPTAEGYVQKTGTQYSYVYNYADHLGNIRLSYARDPQNPDVLKIIEENHYYPFGLKHTNYNSDLLAFKEKDPGPGLMLKAAPVNPGPQFNYDYKYNGKEFQDELGLNLYDYGARNYDPAIGRWMNIDPLAETSRRFSPYTYALNNPVYFIDPDGMTAVDHNPLKSILLKSSSSGAMKTNSGIITATVGYNYARNNYTTAQNFSGSGSATTIVQDNNKGNNLLGRILGANGPEFTHSVSEIKSKISGQYYNAEGGKVKSAEGASSFVVNSTTTTSTVKLEGLAGTSMEDNATISTNTRTETFNVNGSSLSLENVNNSSSSSTVDLGSLATLQAEASNQVSKNKETLAAGIRKVEKSVQDMQNQSMDSDMKREKGIGTRAKYYPSPK